MVDIKFISDDIKIGILTKEEKYIDKKNLIQ
jgi:hypothetical protein